jgi:dihydrofolate synthase/folylpolyglutamate synthase
VSARDYLLSLEQIGIKLGLEQIRALLESLGRPDLAFPCLVVAGTNGKGSVTAMVERGLRAAGYRTGRYTSPHLVDLEERFAIDGRPISPADLDALAPRIAAAAGRMAAPPSFFEATTALALESFRAARVDVAVLEVGLGGRLDATNAVESIAAAITAVDFDHEEYLGHTLEAIAGEKAGIIKPGGLAVLGENPDVVRGVVAQVADARRARLVYAPDGVTVDAVMHEGRLTLALETPRTAYRDVRLGLRGRHQVANAVVAARLLEELAVVTTFAIPSTAVRTALELASWPGRLELFRRQGHDVLLDGAHNPAGARALASYVREVFPPGRVPVVIGVMRDKQVAGILAELAPVASCFICTAAGSPRAASPTSIVEAARRVAPATHAEAVSSPMEAVLRASTRGSPAVVAGSLYLVGEIRAKLS